MLCHETLETFYKGNSNLMFRLKGDFDQLMSLTELEDMMPFERDIYIMLIEQNIEKHNIEKQKKKQ